MRLIGADWPEDDEIVAFTTTREGGVSTGRYESFNLGDHVGDDSGAVAANRQQLVQHHDLREEPRWLNQVHGGRVVVADDWDFESGPPPADAIVCHKGRAVLGILTADCLPILLRDTNARGIAAIHGGWRSLAAGIIASTIETFYAKPSGLVAWLGPAISQEHFEVGDEVRDIFLSSIEDAVDCFVPNDNDRWQADLYGIARLYLERAGVQHIHGGGHCTFAEPGRFYSYRRDGQCGRMASIIWRR